MGMSAVHVCIDISVVLIVHFDPEIHPVLSTGIVFLPSDALVSVRS